MSGLRETGARGPLWPPTTAVYCTLDLDRGLFRQTAFLGIFQSGARHEYNEARQCPTSQITAFRVAADRCPLVDGQAGDDDDRDASDAQDLPGKARTIAASMN